MPLSQTQQLVCAMLFGTTVGVTSTTIATKKSPSSRPVVARQTDNAIVEKSRTISTPSGGSITIFDSPVLGNCLTPDLPEAFEVPELRKPRPPVFQVTQPGGDIAFVSRVPEADTWVMLVAGFGFVGASMRRRKVIA